MSEKTSRRIRKADLNPELSAHVIGAHNVDEVIANITKLPVDPLFLVIDLFCGAGGTSTGFHMAGDVALVIACVNHDKEAIKSHWINFPGVAHFEEDIRYLDLRPLVKLLRHYQKLYPNAKVIIWASLECTNFSKAKGGQPRDADSRTLADHLHRYVEALNPDYIQIENVVEFMSWGPLDEHGKPVSRRNGRDFMRWCNEMCAHGYVSSWRELNSADFGAYTSRSRLFGVFARPELPIRWPQPTHAKKNIKGMFGSLAPWKAVKDVLDFSDTGISIFDRKKPLVDPSLRRIYAGCIRFVAGGEEAFILKYNSTTADGVHIPPSINEPCPTIACQNRLGLVHASFLAQYYGTVNVCDTEGPAPTITTKDRISLVQPQFLDKQYGKGSQQSLNVPAGTVMNTDKHALISTEHFITRDFSGGGQIASVESPAGAILPYPKLNLITADRAFVMPTNYNNTPTSIDSPATTITANRKWHYLVVTEQGEVKPQLLIGRSVIDVKIRHFMMVYGIVDIKMRMLKVRELLRIQGFPAGYHLSGNQTDQKKFIGNSVVPHVVKSWIMALAAIQTTTKTIAA